MQRIKNWIKDHQIFSREHLLKAVLLVGLGIYVFTGLYTELWFMHKGPLPEFFLEDFHFYERALWDTLAGAETYGVTEIGPAYLYPPQALLVVELFAWLPRPVVQIAAFLTANIFLFALMLYLLMKKTNPSLERFLFVLVLAFTFSPFFEILHIGQINMVPVFGVFLLFYFEERSPVAAGAGLALAIVTKVTPLFFLGYLVIRRRWKVILACFAVILLISALALFRYGPEPFAAYPKMFGHMLVEIPDNFYSQAFFRRLVRFLNHESITWPVWMSGGIEAVAAFVAGHITLLQRLLLVYIAMLLVAGGLLTFLGKLPGESLFMMVMIGMNLSPNIMWYHHYIWLFFALLLLMIWRSFNPRVVFWVMLSLLVVQLDRFALPTSGLLIHLFAHPTLLWLLVWMVRQYRAKRQQGAARTLRDYFRKPAPSSGSDLAS